MKSVLRYPGGKWSVAEWIVSLFPPNYEKMVYVEPFVGSGAVFFTKRPSTIETINDLEDEIINLFQVLRSCPEKLAQQIDLTPYSRREYELAYEACDDPLEKARRFMVRSNQAIGAKTNVKCGWRNHKTEKIGGTACKWRGLPDSVFPVARRLQGSQTQLVQIEHMDALTLMRRYNDPGVLMYLDPPYLRSTRRSGRLYRHEMDDEQHEELLSIAVHSKAKIVISGYASALYDDMLSGWYRLTTESQITSGEKAEVVVWLNYEPPAWQTSLF